MSSTRANVESCHFPRLGSGTDGPRRPLSVKVELEYFQELQRLFAKDYDTLTCVLCATWSLVLRCYTGLGDVCFGYEEISRLPINGNELAGRKSFGMSIVKLAIEDKASLGRLVEKAKDTGIRGNPQQHPDVFQYTDEQPFNTSVLFRRHSNLATPGNRGVSALISNTAISKKVICGS